MLTIAVLDDEEIYIESICRITKECMNQMKMDYEIGTYRRGQDVLTDLRRGRCFDIYLLDMKLPDMDGLEVAKKIRRKLSDSILIYVTHYIDFSIEGYEVKAYASLEAALRRKKQPDRYYLVERYGKQEKIFYRDIYYLKKDRKYVVIVHKDGESPVRKSISALLEGFYGKEFLMIDRSYVVNINQVESLKDYE